MKNTEQENSSIVILLKENILVKRRMILRKIKNTRSKFRSSQFSRVQKSVQIVFLRDGLVAHTVIVGTIGGILNRNGVNQ
jgi:hypothetical protein